jgi:hypothetical protein
MKNHSLLDYGFVEATEFEGIMPAAAEKLGTIGASDVVVKEGGLDGNGIDALEVVDVTKVFNKETAETEE